MHNENPSLLGDSAIDRAIVKWRGEAASPFVLVAGYLLSMMRAGKVRKGGELPASAPYAQKIGVSENAVSNAKLMLLALGLVEKDSYHRYVSLVEPRCRPDARQVLDWQHSHDPAESIMADLADQIITGRLTPGAELPGPETLREQWGHRTAQTAIRALKRLAAYPGLVTVQDSKYFVT